MQQAEKMVVDQLPIIPIYHYVNKGLRSPTLGGWYKNVRDLHPFQFMYMTE